AEAMRKLDAEHADYGEDVAWLSTHPASAARIAAAELAGAEFLAAHPEKAEDVPGFDPCAEEGACAEAEAFEFEECEECEDDACYDACVERLEAQPDEAVPAGERSTRPVTGPARTIP